MDPNMAGVPVLSTVPLNCLYDGSPGLCQNQKIRHITGHPAVYMGCCDHAMAEYGFLCGEADAEGGG